MDKLEQFTDIIRKEMAVTLATAAEGRVTMRLVSPVEFEGGVLLFTSAASTKFAQLKANPRCCLSAGTFFAEAEAEFRGACMAQENEGLRRVYCGKFPDAFDEGVGFGGRGADFIILHLTRLSGWGYPDDIPTEGGFPTVPFELKLK